MSDVSSIASSEEQETPTFPMFGLESKADTLSSSYKQKIAAFFTNKNSLSQSIEQSNIEQHLSKLKSCILVNYCLSNKEEVAESQKFTPYQQYYSSKEISIDADIDKYKAPLGQNEKNDQERLKSFIFDKIMKNSTQTLPIQAILQKNKQQEEETVIYEPKSKPINNSKIGKNDSAFWKYIVLDKDPAMKRTIIKPCRFWIGECVQYRKNDRIIKRIRKSIGQIFAHSFDQDAFISTNTNISTENFTKGSVIIKPNSKFRMNSLQKITITINKDYSFNLNQDKLIILEGQGKNKIVLKKKAYILQNTLKVACTIDLQIYLNI